MDMIATRDLAAGMKVNMDDQSLVVMGTAPNLHQEWDVIFTDGSRIGVGIADLDEPIWELA